jgi:DNA-binding LytR/AlgR family response regulator
MLIIKGGMDMLKIAICDDVVEVTSQLDKMLIELGKKHSVLVEIDVFFSGVELLNHIMDGNSFDLIFLDIEMEDMDGIQLGLKIRNDMMDDSTQIAYISGKQSYAMDLFQIRPIDFLIKPLRLEHVAELFLTALRIINSKNSYFQYKKGHTYNKIESKDIIYFESDDRKINIITKDSRDSFYGSMDYVYDKVKNLGFLYIHKSYLVNNLYIRSYLYDRVIMSNNIELPISQSRRKSMREKLIRLVGGGE